MASGGRVKRGAQRPATRQLEAGEIVDDALARTSAAAGEWLKKNFAVLQWFIIAGIVAWVGYAIYNYRAGRAAEQASAKLVTAIRAEGARIGAEDSKPIPDRHRRNASRLRDRRSASQAAEQQYRAVADSGTTAAASFAKLGLASVLYDQGKFADAKSPTSPSRTASSPALTTREGPRASKASASASKARATKKARARRSASSPTWTRSAQRARRLHQARLAVAAATRKGQRAAERCAKAPGCAGPATDSKETKKPFSSGPTGYLQQSVKDLLRQVDPSAVPSPSPGGITAEQLQELQQQMAHRARTAARHVEREAARAAQADVEQERASEPRPTGERAVKLRLACGLLLASLGFGAAGCEAMRGGANPELPLWLQRPNFALQVNYTRPLVVPRAAAANPTNAASPRSTRSVTACSPVVVIAVCTRSAPTTAA